MDFDPVVEQARHALLSVQRTEACSNMWASCAGPRRTADSRTLTSSACSCQDTVVPAPPAKPCTPELGNGSHQNSGTCFVMFGWFPV